MVNKVLLLGCEKWYPVGLPDFEKHYEASDCGQVRNSKTKKVLGLRKDKKGYSRCALSANGKHWDGHRAIVIARTFPEICGEWFEKAEPDHINGWRIDDRPSNLRVVSHKDNTNNPITVYRYKKRDNTRLLKQSEQCKCQTIIDGISFNSQREAAKFLRISEYKLSAIKRGVQSNTTGHQIIFSQHP